LHEGVFLEVAGFLGLDNSSAFVVSASEGDDLPAIRLARGLPEDGEFDGGHAFTSNKSPAAKCLRLVSLAFRWWCSWSYAKWQRWHKAFRFSGSQCSGTWSRCAMVKTIL